MYTHDLSDDSCYIVCDTTHVVCLISRLMWCDMMLLDLDEISLCETYPYPSSSHAEVNLGPLDSQTRCSTTRLHRCS